jgi:hypothetical protein
MHERADLKRDLVHLGVPVSTIRRLTRQAVRVHGVVDVDEIARHTVAGLAVGDPQVNLDRMNLVTLREAAKPLPDGDALLTAYWSARR